MLSDNPPFFSIIIPTYNRAVILLKSLERIFSQTFKSFEIIIVDDGSNDGTEREVLKIQNNQIKYFKTENRERSHARNFGLKKSSGKYINYFDSDDIMYADRLQVVHDFIESNSEPDVVYTHYDFVDANGVKNGEMRRFYKSFTKDILYNNFLAADAPFLKREIAVQFPFHDNRQIITAEDWELWLRVHTVFEFTELPVSTFAIVQHPGRSLQNISPVQVEARELYFSKIVKENNEFEKKYGKKAVDLFLADRYTFVALTWNENGNWSRSFDFWMKSLITSYNVMKRKRFWAVFKKICFL